MTAAARLLDARAAALLTLAGLALCRVGHHLWTTPKEGRNA